MLGVQPCAGRSGNLNHLYTVDRPASFERFTDIAVGQEVFGGLLNLGGVGKIFVATSDKQRVRLRENLVWIGCADGLVGQYVV